VDWAEAGARVEGEARGEGCVDCEAWRRLRRTDRERQVVGVRGSTRACRRQGRGGERGHGMVYTREVRAGGFAAGGRGIAAGGRSCA
jgi:hypothetical protein